MPVSTSVHISHCLRYIINLRPQSILDIGCGFGMWGFLGRMYLDVAEERVQPDQWRVRIDGIELFEPYIQAHQRALYSSIAIGDIRELAPNLDRYELIIAGDVIEHLEKDEGERVIEHLYDKAMRALMVNIPLGEGWDHPERHGNPGELHRSQWYPEDFYPYPNVAEHFELPAGAYGSFFCPKDCSIEARVEGLLLAAERQLSLNRADHALECLRKGNALMPGHRDTALALVDILLKQKQTDAAVIALRNAVEADPDFHYAYIALAKILRATQRWSEGEVFARKLLARTGVPPETRAEAEALLRA